MGQPLGQRPLPCLDELAALEVYTPSGTLDAIAHVWSRLYYCSADSIYCFLLA